MMTIGNRYGQPETANDYWVNPGHYGYQPTYRQGYTWRLTTSPAVNYAVDATNFLEEALYRQTSQNIRNNQGIGTFIPVPETPGFDSLVQLSPQTYTQPAMAHTSTDSILSSVLPEQGAANIAPFDGLLTAFQAEKAHTSTPFQVGTAINSPAWNTDPQLQVNFQTLPTNYGVPSGQPAGYTLSYSVRPLSGWLENAERAGATRIEPVSVLASRFGNTTGGFIGNGQVGDSLGTSSAVAQLGGLYDTGNGASSRYQPGQFMQAYKQANSQGQTAQAPVATQVAPSTLPQQPMVQPAMATTVPPSAPLVQPSTMNQNVAMSPSTVVQATPPQVPSQQTSLPYGTPTQPLNKTSSVPTQATLAQPTMAQPTIGQPTLQPMTATGINQTAMQPMTSANPTQSMPYGSNYSHLSMLSSSTRGLLEDSATALPGIEAQLQSLVTEAQQQTATKKGQMQTVEQAASQQVPSTPTQGVQSMPQEAIAQPFTSAPTQAPTMQPINRSTAPNANVVPPTTATEQQMAQSKINQLYQQGQNIVRLYQTGLLPEQEANQILSEINTALYSLMQRYGLEPVQVAQAIQAQQQAQATSSTQQVPSQTSMAPQRSSPLEQVFPTTGITPTNTGNQTEAPSRRGMMLAQLNRQIASQMNSTGWCYKGVARAAQRMGINLTGASAYMAADQLAKRPDFKEVTPSRWIPPQQLPTLVKPGDIVVYDRGEGKPHGHIATVLGQENGEWKEASDHISKLNVNYPTGKARVFRPLDQTQSSTIA
ncbi:MAG: hypothetical protein ACKO37_05620 [Vampirovibrionales bacterium]